MPAIVSSLPEMLRERSCLLGWSCLADPMVAGLMARSGFDAVLLDQQHGAYDTASSLAGLSELALTGTPGIVRVAVGDFAMASRMLDGGASGIVAPMINTVADARRLAAATKFPPQGERSWGPERARLFSGLADGGAYLAGADGRTLTIAMCETVEAMAELDGILAVPGIDGILVGPADLSIALSRGAALDPNGATVTAALEEIGRKTVAAGKIPCAFTDGSERARAVTAMGYRLVSISTDSGLIADAFGHATRAARAG